VPHGHDNSGFPFELELRLDHRCDNDDDDGDASSTSGFGSCGEEDGHPHVTLRPERLSSDDQVGTRRVHGVVEHADCPELDDTSFGEAHSGLVEPSQLQLAADDRRGVRLTPPWTPERVIDADDLPYDYDNDHRLGVSQREGGRTSPPLSFPGGDADTFLLDGIGAEFNLVEYLGLSDDDEEVDNMLLCF
jgi:hypothetical protein